MIRWNEEAKGDEWEDMLEKEMESYREREREGKVDLLTINKVRYA